MYLLEGIGMLVFLAILFGVMAYGIRNRGKVIKMKHYLKISFYFFSSMFYSKHEKNFWEVWRAR